MSAEYKEPSQLQVSTLKNVGEKLAEYREHLEETVERTNEMLRGLIKDGYYNRVGITFRCRVYETLLFYQGAAEEISQLELKIEKEVQEEHVDALQQLAETAANLHTSLRFSWKTDSYPEDLAGQHFLVLAQVYKEEATMLEEMKGLEEVAIELKQYVNDSWF